MYNYNFEMYDKEAEKENGDYWKFIDASISELKKENIYLYRINKVLSEIKNEELKSKMHAKLFNIAMNDGFFYFSINESIDIFTNDEKKQILEHEMQKELDKYDMNPHMIKHLQNAFINIIYLFDSVEDPNWSHDMITNLLNIIKDNPDKSSLIKIIEVNKDKPSLYLELIRNYYDFLPEVYKNYIKMQNDPNYILNKSSQFTNEDFGIDPRISIGPEIEANNDLGIHIDVSNQNGYKNYIRTTDATVPNGDEVFPIKPIHNTKEDVAMFCGLCETMKELGYHYDKEYGNAAGQINLGLDYLDSKEAILNFYEIYCNCEELLYYICNEEGDLFRQSIFTSSRIKPISEIIGRRNIDEELTRADIINLFNTTMNDNEAIPQLQYKKNSVCLRGNSEKDYRLEFRIPNGGCNYKHWINNIRLFGKMFEVAKKLADAMKKEYLSTEEEALLNLKIDLQDSTLSLEEKLSILMNLLFKDDNIKQIYYKKFVSTIKTIEETGDDRYHNKHGALEPGFAETEFINEYTSRINQDYDGKTIEYDSIEGFIKK